MLFWNTAHIISVFQEDRRRREERIQAEERRREERRCTVELERQQETRKNEATACNGKTLTAKHVDLSSKCMDVKAWIPTPMATFVGCANDHMRHGYSC